MLDIEIDKLTNSFENALTGESFETLVLLIASSKLKEIKVRNWIFNWKSELLSDSRQVCKLVTAHDRQLIHGLISISVNEDHVYMHLIENAKFNKGAAKNTWVLPETLFRLLASCPSKKDLTE